MVKENRDISTCIMRVWGKQIIPYRSSLQEKVSIQLIQITMLMGKYVNCGSMYFILRLQKR